MALLLFWMLGMVLGKPVGASSVVARVLPGKPAARAGIRAGDRLLAVNAVSGKWDNLRDEIQRHPRERIRVTVRRGSRRLVFTMVPIAAQEPTATMTSRGLIKAYKVVTVGQIGVVNKLVTRPMKLGESVVNGLRQAGDTVTMLVIGLAGVVTRHVPAGDMFGGPVRLVGELAEQSLLGWGQFLRLVAVYSTLIGLINMFPIPALDGARAAFLIVEAVRRKPLDQAKEAMVHVVGFMLLIAAMVLLTYHDILFYVTRQ
jgi:regulator of sigma E protease